MRIIDLHCYPSTQEWIDCQGPYVDALAKYWKREWAAKTEAEVISEFTTAGVESCLVALDLETTVGTPPCEMTTSIQCGNVIRIESFSVGGLSIPLKIAQ